MRERHLRSSFFLLLVVSACAIAPRKADASVTVAASLEDLARASSAIARVTALDRESWWEDGRIVTYSRVRIDSVIAGAAPAGTRELRLRTLGGTVGRIGQSVEGEASLTPAESSIVFLAPRTASSGAVSAFVVVGRGQGQLLVRRDVHGREIVRVGDVGALVDRRIHPPLRPAGRRVVELDGVDVDAVTTQAKSAWEACHAR